MLKLLKALMERVLKTCKMQSDRENKARFFSVSLISGPKIHMLYFEGQILLSCFLYHVEDKEGVGTVPLRVEIS